MNLKTLSEQLGLSQTTVSRALNGYPEVSPKTRERVIKAAAELNYRPNRFAKSLATGKTGHIGLIYPIEYNLMNPLFNEFLRGVTRKLVEAGMDLCIIPTAAANELSTFQEVVRSGRVDGLIISSPLLKDPRIEFMIGTDIPFIVHGRTELPGHSSAPPQAPPYSFIDIDNTGAFERATRLLLNMGHQNIALVNGSPNMTFAHHRQQGYKNALKAAGLTARPELIFALYDMSEKNAYEAASKALESPHRPSAFLVSSIILALGVKRAIEAQGLKPGRDIALITHDDALPFLEADQFKPALTTVYSPIRVAGYDITHHLAKMISSGGKHKIQRIMDVDLIVRDSICDTKSQYR